MALPARTRQPRNARTRDHERQPMKATAHRRDTSSFTHRIDIGHHRLVADEPREHGGDDEGPSPQELLAASLASCAAVTIELYAKHKGWDIGPLAVECQYTPAERGAPTKFKLTLRLPDGCTEEQAQRLLVVATKCPVHRTLDGEVMFEERVELVAQAAI